MKNLPLKPDVIAIPHGITEEGIERKEHRKNQVFTCRAVTCQV